jgi:hypothetical protein
LKRQLVLPNTLSSLNRGLCGSLPARLFLLGRRIKLVGVLVSCWVSNSRSPATRGLLVVAFFTPPMASCGRWPGKTVMEVVGIALRLWVVCGNRPFPLQGDSSVSRRRRQWIEIKKRRYFWTRVTVFQFGPLSFNICFNRTLGPNCNWTPTLWHRLHNGPWTLISCNLNLN